MVADAASQLGITVAGVFDDDPACLMSRAGAPLLGGLSRVRDDTAALQSGWFVCLGDIVARRRLLGRVSGAGGCAAVIAHPRACLSPRAVLASGVFVAPLAMVHTAASIGPHAIVNSAAVVEHHCVVGENAHIAPRAVLGGGVTIGADTLIGLGAVVLPGVRVGARCVVGAGAVVRRDVPDGSRVAGIPARPIGPSQDVVVPASAVA